MIINNVKNKLKAGELVIGSWISIPSLDFAEIMCSSGFDFLVIDLEHSSIDLETAREMMRIIEMSGIPPFVRAGENDSCLIKRLLDSGCYGIIFPNIKSKNEAECAIEKCFYPPTGIRGVGLSRAQGYGQKFEEYKNWYENNVCIITQIEHINAINELNEILSLDKIDATMVGPYDLSSSIDCPGEFNNPKFKDSINKYEKVSKELNKNFGYHVVQQNDDLLLEKIDKGYKFLVYGVDQVIFSNQCEIINQQLKKIRKLL